jgi:hypothetical protein
MASLCFRWKPDAETLKLFFGNGGTFRADDLQTMSNMYNELQAKYPVATTEYAKLNAKN